MKMTSPPTAARRVCDQTVADRAAAVEQAHAAANAKGAAEKTQAEMGIVFRKEGASVYGPLWKVWAILRPTWGGMLKVRFYPIVTLGKQLLYMIGNLV